MIKVFQIDGIECGHCADRLESALMTIHGVNNANVNKHSEIATVQLSFEVSDDVIKNVIKEQGFEIKKKIKQDEK